MQGELDFSRPKVPNTGNNCPETSFEAADKMRHSAVCVRSKVFKFIGDCEGYGATSGEIHDHFKMDKNTTSPRITELKDDGLIEKTELRRKNTKGNKEVVWRII
jgi:predicted transcriptional regulator